MEVITESPEETKSLGRKVATDLEDRAKNKEHSAKVRIFALVGDLGSGKTTFVQGFAEGLGIKTRIISPTFILLRKYSISPYTNHHPPTTNFYHVDLYRLETGVETEIRNLGVTDVWKEPGNIVAIEWAEKIAQIVPKEATWIKFETLKENKRRITIY